jgi:hypothetical protein
VELKRRIIVLYLVAVVSIVVSAIQGAWLIDRLCTDRFLPSNVKSRGAKHRLVRGEIMCGRLCVVWVRHFNFRCERPIRLEQQKSERGCVCEAGGKYTLARITVPSLTLTLAALLPSISVCNGKRTVLIVLFEGYCGLCGIVVLLRFSTPYFLLLRDSTSDCDFALI